MFLVKIRNCWDNQQKSRTTILINDEYCIEFKGSVREKWNINYIRMRRKSFWFSRIKHFTLKLVRHGWISKPISILSNKKSGLIRIEMISKQDLGWTQSQPILSMFHIVLSAYICSIKRAGSTLHWIVQPGQYDWLHVQYMLYRLGSCNF